MKAHEIFNRVDYSLVKEMFDWFRANDRNVYKTLISTISQNRKVRLQFIQQKSLEKQYEWLLSVLKLKACDMIGDHLLLAYLMAAQQPLLCKFCDGLGIEHDDKGSVTADLPKSLDQTKLNETVDLLLTEYDPKLLTLYLHCFNLQVPNGWPELVQKLNEDKRLKLTDL